MYEAPDVVAACGFKQMKRAREIRIDDRLRRKDAPVHMRFGGEMNNGIRTEIGDGLFSGVRVEQIRFDEPVTSVPGHGIEVLQIPRIGERIEVEHLRRGVIRKHKPNEGGTDETGPTRNEQLHLCWISQS